MNTLFRRWPQVIALLTPLLLWCAYPGGGEIWPLLVIALVPLMATLPSMNNRQAVWTGILAGTLQYLLLLYWIIVVLGQYGGLPIFIAVPALLLLACYMATYLGVFTVLGRLLFTAADPFVALIAVPSLWVGLDWLRGQLFTGFPWMDIGYALGSVPQLIQSADLFGHGGLSFLVVMVNTCIALIICGEKRWRNSLSLIVPTILLVCLAGYYSNTSWQAVKEQLAISQNDSVVVGIVQGNIDQSRKWSPDNQQHTLSVYLQNSQSLFEEKRPDFVVWPETALPFYPQTYSDFGLLQGFVAQYDTALLTGAPWYEIRDRKKKDIRYYNSAQLLEPQGNFSSYYYKSHLVPFGEYVPLKKLLPFLAPLVEAVGDFSPGTIGEPLQWRKARIGVLICFEAIFPDIARAWVENGANVLVNLTNDAWYGKSSAPHHSMVMSVFRAVETRRSVVRSANTGISGFIDPLGRVIEPSEIFTTWARAENVALMNGKTIFVRWGYMFPPVCLVMAVLVTGIVSRQRKRSFSKS
jgi:apolipoprotein N-acyltransferase